MGYVFQLAEFRHNLSAVTRSQIGSKNIPYRVSVQARRQRGPARNIVGIFDGFRPAETALRKIRLHGVFGLHGVRRNFYPPRPRNREVSPDPPKRTVRGCERGKARSVVGNSVIDRWGIGSGIPTAGRSAAGRGSEVFEVTPAENLDYQRGYILRGEQMRHYRPSAEAEPPQESRRWPCWLGRHARFIPPPLP